MLRIFQLSLIVLLLTPSLTRSGERLSVDGYVKTFGVGYDPARFEAAATSGQALPPQSFLWASNNRARVNVGFEAADWLTLDASYDLSLRIQDKRLFQPDVLLAFAGQSIYRIDDLDPFVYPDGAAEANNTALFQNLDRLFFTVSTPQFDVYVGRQAIAWGSAHAVNPTDIIAPYLYNEIDTEDRIGVDAARLRIPAGSLGEVDAGYVAGKDFEWDKSAVFLRGKSYLARTDVAVLLVGFRENTMLGIDLTRSLGGAGAWVEAGYVFVNGLTNRSRSDERMDYLRASAGVDYNFAQGVYVFGEYHYNEAGARDPNDYLARISTVPYREGAVYLLGEHYLIPGAFYMLTPLVTVFGEALINISDGSFLMAPSVEYNVSENFYLAAGAFAGFGGAPETTSASVFAGSSSPFAGSAVVVPVYRSEFGAYPDTYYLSLRFYY